MKNSINQLLICAPLCNITSNIPKFLKNTNYTTSKEVFFFNPVNKNPKCIRNASEISESLCTSEILEKSEMHQKCIRNTYFSPVHPPRPILKHILSLHIHPQLLHLILHSHISPPPTHPKTINILKCKWLPTISLNFFPSPWTNS